MAKVLEKDIITRLDRIEEKIDRALSRNFQDEEELTEEEALKIAQEGEREYKEGKTEVLKSFADLD